LTIRDSRVSAPRQIEIGNLACVVHGDDAVKSRIAESVHALLAFAQSTLRLSAYMMERSRQRAVQLSELTQEKHEQQTG